MVILVVTIFHYISYINMAQLNSQQTIQRYSIWLCKISTVQFLTLFSKLFTTPFITLRKFLTLISIIFHAVIKKHGGNFLMVDETTIDTNLLYATVDDQVMSVPKFIERLEKVHIAIVTLHFFLCKEVKKILNSLQKKRRNVKENFTFKNHLYVLWIIFFAKNFLCTKMRRICKLYTAL